MTLMDVMGFLDGMGDYAYLVFFLFIYLVIKIIEWRLNYVDRHRDKV